MVAGNSHLKEGRHRSVVAPRLLYKKEAASYCRMGVETFEANCPVEPIRVGSGIRGLRFDVRDLDNWIESLKSDSSGAVGRQNWLDRVGNGESSN
jgi:hypothetical protein